MTVVFSPLSLQAFFFPSQVHICCVVTGISHKTCGCGYVKVHMQAQCTIECVVFTQSVQHFLVSSPTFFLYLSLLLCRTVGRGGCSSLSCYRFTHHSCTVCIAMSRQRVEMYTCVCWHVLGWGKHMDHLFVAATGSLHCVFCI